MGKRTETWMVREAAAECGCCDIIVAKKVKHVRSERIVAKQVFDLNDANRIVATHNACAGIPDPAALRAQRDELLAACEAVLYSLEQQGLAENMPVSTRDLRAAIANAKGSA